MTGNIFPTYTRQPNHSDVPELTFDDLVGASLGIFPETTEQQRAHFR